MRSNFIYLFSLTALILFSSITFAQDFEVAPVRLDFNAEPGDNQTKVVNVKNHSNKKVSFIVSISDFLPGSDGKRQIMPPNTTRRSAANWLNINPSFFELNPGEQLPVQVTMLVPGDEYGAVWSMLYVQPTREQTSWDADKSLGAGVMVSGRIGVVVYQSPSSNKNHSLKVTNLIEITTAEDKIRKFSATIDNLGDKVTGCKVHLIASDINTSEEKQFPSLEVEIFPKMTRNVTVELPKGELNHGTYAIAVIVDYGARFALEGAQIVIDIE
jgi:P pilus assembly chaperone PapD